MSISLVEVAGANFRTDYDSDNLNTDFMGRLGMRKRYLPARLAIARSLAMSAPVEVPADELEPGKVIKGDTLFGTGTALSVWLALIVERAGEPDTDIKRLVSLVGAHWRRGLASRDSALQSAPMASTIWRTRWACGKAHASMIDLAFSSRIDC